MRKVIPNILFLFLSKCLLPSKEYLTKHIFPNQVTIQSLFSFTCCFFLFTGVIKKVQGFASQSVGLVDTRPEISEDEAVQTLRAQWNHTRTVEEVEVRLDDPELQVLNTVSNIVQLTPVREPIY